MRGMSPERKEVRVRVKEKISITVLTVPAHPAPSSRGSAIPPRSRTGALDPLLDLPVALAVYPVNIILPSAIAPRNASRAIMALRNVKYGAHVVHVPLGNVLIRVPESSERHYNRPFLQVEERCADGLVHCTNRPLSASEDIRNGQSTYASVQRPCC